MSNVKFGKINFLVRDAQAAFKYARETLGADEVFQPQETPIGEVAQVDLHGLIMEFIQPPSGSRMDKMIDKRGEGIDSIGFAQPADSGLAATAWLHPKNPLSLSIELFTPGATKE